MCPLWPLHTIIMYLLVLLPLWILSTAVIHASAAKWNATFYPSNWLKVEMSESVQLQVLHRIDEFGPDFIERGLLYLESDNPNIASVPDKGVLLNTQQQFDNATLVSVFNITANFLGYANVKAIVKKDSETVESDESATIVVVRKERLIDRIFVTSVIVLVSIICINFGCALDWDVILQTVKRPVGPAIGIFCQFFAMPLIGFGLGQLLFRDSVALQLGFFFTGIVPAGGASNIWTYTLGGNLNLSLTMTAVSTFTAFLLIPFWAFTLGRVIFSNGNMVVPYMPIARSALGLIVSLAIGAFLQYYTPRFAKFMVRILRPFSTLLLVFIITFAIVTNLYLFQLFTWRIALAGFCLPFFGYVIGGFMATLLNQMPEDTLAISIETGIQNTGVAIFMLRSALGQPEADITTVAPVAVAVMTPIPLLVLYIVRRCRGKTYRTKSNSSSYSDKITSLHSDDYLTGSVVATHA